MKKLMTGILSILFAVGLVAGIATQASASPAPQLSGIQITQIYDNQGNRGRVTEGYPGTVQGNPTFKGGTLYVVTKFTGYPNWGTVFYRDSRATGQAIQRTVVERTPIYGRNGVATGWKEVAAIPFTAFSGSYPTIYVSADSMSGRTYAASVSMVHLQK